MDSDTRSSPNETTRLASILVQLLLIKPERLMQEQASSEQQVKCLELIERVIETLQAARQCIEEAE